MVEAIGAAELELDPGGWQLLPPALKPGKDRRNLPQAQGHAGGNTRSWIQTPELPQRRPQPLAPPIVQGQIQAAPGRRAQSGEQGFEGLAWFAAAGFEQRKHGLQFGRDGGGLVAAMARIQATGFADAADAVLLHHHQQMLHRGGGAPADRQRHGLGEGKVPQAAAHGGGGGRAERMRR